MSVTAPQSPTVAPASAAAASKPASGQPASASFDALLNSLRGSDPTRQTGSKSDGSASADETEDRFLKLLVAQMKNQDPMNPADNAQMTSQMAQINTVKGIDKMNTAIAKLVERSTLGSATEAAAMVGRSVLVEGDTMTLVKDGTAKAGFELGGEASSAKVEILDAKGAVVDSWSTGKLSAGLQTFEWDGRIGSGATASAADPGSYRFRVSAVNGSDTVAATALTAAPVLAVTRGADGVSLQLGAFGSRALDAVKGIL